MNKQNKSFSNRWSKHLKKYGHTQISGIFLNFYSLLNLSNEEVMFLIHCFSYKWTDNHPYPSFNTIAVKMGNKRNTIQGYARSLERKGFIKRINRSGQSSKIDLYPLIEILERLAPYQNSDRASVGKIIKVCLKIDTKE